MTLEEILRRIDFIYHLYDIIMRDYLAKHNIEDAKQDKKALEYAAYIIKERIAKNGGSEEIYTK